MQFIKTDSDTQPGHEPLFSIHALSFIMHTDFSVTILFFKKLTMILASCQLDTLKYSRKAVAMVQYGIITYKRCLDTADYYPQCGRRLGAQAL